MDIDAICVLKSIISTNLLPDTTIRGDRAIKIVLKSFAAIKERSGEQLMEEAFAKLDVDLVDFIVDRIFRLRRAFEFKSPLLNGRLVGWERSN